jgi:GNAT superfamily N-acetyltransferase
MKNIDVGMIRSHMRAIPVHKLPPGYAFRPFSSSDAETWVRVQAEANAGLLPIDMDTFRTDFGGHEDLLTERSWFVTGPDQTEVASIAAWWRDTSEGPQGLIHWVAVLPQCQGKGIGKAIMTRAMEWLAHEYDSAYLNTSSPRIPAIKFYLDFGFVPDMQKDRAEEGWAAVREVLRHPALGNA